MTVVLDTNVLISALLHPSRECGQIMEYVLAGHVTWLITPPILAEYGEVCARPELPLSAPARQQLLHALRGLPILPLPPLTAAAPRCPDRDDQPFLTAACHYRADYLITGNTKHFPTTLAPPPHIVTPRAWLALVL